MHFNRQYETHLLQVCPQEFEACLDVFGTLMKWRQELGTVQPTLSEAIEKEDG